MKTPAIVNLAVRLTWAAMFVVLLIAIMIIRHITLDRSDAIPLGIALFALVAVSLWALFWLSVKVQSGKNWARWTHVTLAVTSLLTVMEDPSKGFELSLARVTLLSIAVVLYNTAAALLLTHKAHIWFQDHSDAQRVA